MTQMSEFVAPETVEEATAILAEKGDGAYILAGGTDGTDGPTDAAGALADTATMKSAAAMGLNPHHFLANNDAYHFFQKLGDLFVTGPTNTNVMDLQIFLIRKDRPS